MTVYDAKSKALHNLTDENFNGAIMVVSQVVDNFNFINFPKFNILTTKEYIQQLPFFIYFRKHSCLLEAFDNQIHAYESSGLINYWANSFLKLLQFQNKNNAKALKLNQFFGIVTVCGCLILVSIFLFVFELMSESNALVRTILDFLTYNEKQKGETD